MTGACLGLWSLVGIIEMTFFKSFDSLNIYWRKAGMDIKREIWKSKVWARKRRGKTRQYMCTRSMFFVLRQVLYNKNREGNTGVVLSEGI